MILLELIGAAAVACVLVAGVRWLVKNVQIRKDDK